MNQLVNSPGEPEGNWIQTFTGKKFWPLTPRPEDICIEDIAHALSNKCRFSGHCRDYYSVAQHSVYVSQICGGKDAFWGLLHDACEAYLVDLPKPLKVLPEFAWFVTVENRVQLAVCQRFGLDSVQPETVHVADRTLLMTEKRDLMELDEIREWQIKYKEQPMDTRIVALDPTEAKEQFLERYRELITCL